MHCWDANLNQKCLYCSISATPCLMPKWYEALYLLQANKSSKEIVEILYWLEIGPFAHINKFVFNELVDTHFKALKPKIEKCKLLK